MVEIIPLWLVKALSFAAVFTVMSSVGTALAPGQFVDQLRRPGALLRGLACVLLVVPVLGFVVGAAIGLGLDERMGLALMAAAPGAPLALQRALRTGGHAGFAPTLQVAVALLAIPALPLWVAIGNAVFGTRAAIAPQAVAVQVFLAQLLPLTLGALLARWWPARAARIGRAAAAAGTMLLVAAVLSQAIDLYLVIAKARPLPMLGAGLVTLAAIATGYPLGGRDLATRHAIAVGAAQRNVGLALLVSTANDAADEVKVAVISYLLVQLALVILYISVRQRIMFNGR